MLPTPEDVLRTLRQDLENAPRLRPRAGWEPPAVACRACGNRVNVGSRRGKDAQVSAALDRHVSWHRTYVDHDPATFWWGTFDLHGLAVVRPYEAGPDGYALCGFLEQRFKRTDGQLYARRSHECALRFIFQRTKLVSDAGFPTRPLRRGALLISGEAYRFMLDVADTHPSGPSVHRLDEMTALIKVFRAMKDARREAP